MFRNYLKMAFRNTLKYKAYSFINVLGLAIGMTCCLLILVYVQDELSYDKFHQKADRIYRIAVETESAGKRFQYPSIGGGWAQAFVNDFPEVTSAARLFRVNPAWLTVEDQRFREERFYFADSTYYDLFDFHFLLGNPETALDQPNSIVLTEVTAIKYFGTVSNAFDKRLNMEFFGQELDLQVTGIIENVPRNSHFYFDMMTSLSTVRVAFGQNVNNFLNGFLFTAFYTYFLVEENANIANLETQLPLLLEKYANEQVRSFVKALFLQPLTGIHLGSNLLNEMQPNSDVLYVYIFSAVAILTLFIACINFMNLATARSANRAKEVGLRKVIGAHRKSLIYQFIGESSFMAFISLLIAIGLSEFLMPFFNNLAGKELDIEYLDNPTFLLGVIGITLFVGLASGSYPALFLSAFRPVEVLKGKLKAGSKSSGLGKTLVVIQFG
ncbi:ABC transporter permease, partial [bacterium]|nr:ABC transporter permease [bacterium]